MPRQKHGGYSLMKAMSKGTLDKRSRPAVAMARVRRSLVASLGASSFSDLHAGQRLLVDQAAMLAVVTSLMAARAIADGIFDKKGSINKTLSKGLLAYHAALRRCLDSLFVNHSHGDGRSGGSPDVGALLADADGKQETTEKHKRGSRR